MTTPCACDLCATNRAIWENPQPTVHIRDAATYEDEATLLRSHGLSIGARREQRLPKPFVVNELGYTPTGTWVPESAA